MVLYIAISTKPGGLTSLATASAWSIDDPGMVPGLRHRDRRVVRMTEALQIAADVLTTCTLGDNVMDIHRPPNAAWPGAEGLLAQHLCSQAQPLRRRIATLSCAASRRVVFAHVPGALAAACRPI